MSDSINHTTLEQVQKVLGLLQDTLEHQEQAISFLDALSENAEFMALLKSKISIFEEHGRLSFLIDQTKYTIRDNTLLFLRLVRLQLVSLHGITALHFQNITSADLASVCSYLTEIVHLKLEVSRYWRLQSVSMQTLPKELSLMTSLEVLTLSRQQSLQTCEVDAPLTVKQIKIEGGSDSFYEQLLGWVPNLEQLSITRSWRGSSLTRIPDSIGECSKLRSLLVTGHYQLKSVSSEIGKCVSLQHVSFQGSALSTLPYSMQSLKQLKYLNVANTPMKYIPKQLLALPSLKQLNASRCSSLIIQTNVLFQEKVWWQVPPTMYPNSSKHRTNFVIQDFFDKGHAESLFKERSDD